MLIIVLGRRFHRQNVGAWRRRKIWEGKGTVTYSFNLILLVVQAKNNITVLPHYLEFQLSLCEDISLTITRQEPITVLVHFSWKLRLGSDLIRDKNRLSLSWFLQPDVVILKSENGKTVHWFALKIFATVECFTPAVRCSTRVALSKHS